MQAKVLALFKDLQKEFGFACLFITHDLAVVDMLAHRVGVLYRGEMLESGRGWEVLQNPQRSYTKRLIASLPVPDPRFQAVSDEADQLIVSMTGENATLPAIAQALNAAGHTTATGQEWNTSRVRDYRHKLRERGLI